MSTAEDFHEDQQLTDTEPSDLVASKDNHAGATIEASPSMHIELSRLYQRNSEMTRGDAEGRSSTLQGEGIDPVSSL